MENDELRELMNRMNRGTVLRLAVETYGPEAQQDMMIEEMSELTKALCKLKRAATREAKKAATEQIIEEMADVQIMLDQMRLIFGKTGDAESEKLSRLVLRLMERGRPANGRGEDP